MVQGLRAAKALVSAVVLAWLAGCGGGGGAGGGSAAAPSGGAPSSNSGAGAPVHRLFVSDFAQGKVAMFSAATPTGASFAAQPLLSLPMPRALAYDGGRDLLYVASGSGIEVHPDARTLAAGAAPGRRIELPAEVLWINDLQLDAANDVLYVAVSRQYDGQVLEVRDASTWSGAVAPVRAITVNDGADRLAIDLSRDLMYVGNGVIGVHVFTGFAAASGVVWPARTLLGVQPIGGLALDVARDRLYVATGGSGLDPGGLAIVGTASTATPVATATLALPGLAAVTLDAANDRLYVGGYDKAYVLEAASGLGAASPLPDPAVLATPNASAIAGFAVVP